MYNAAAWIDRCLGSVRRQSIEEWECVVIDNGSTDVGADIVNEYVLQDGRIRLLRETENLGPGPARNIGVSAARGEYITFLDADDWVDADTYKQLLSCTVSKPDLVLGATKLKPTASREQLLRHYPPSSCFHLYRRQFLVEQGLVFPSQRSSEDSYFVATCVLRAQSWQTTNYCGYHIYENPTSVSRRKDPTRYKQKMQVFSQLIDFACRYDMQHEYSRALRRLYIRKGCLMTLKEYWENNRPVKLGEIIGILRETQKQLRRL